MTVSINPEDRDKMPPTSVNPEYGHGRFGGVDMNKYATKKTLGQGMLDVALLTANASQLKYVLRVGTESSYYYILLTLILISIALQTLVALMAITISLLGDCQVHIPHKRTFVLAVNYSTLFMVLVITIVNIVTSAIGYDVLPPS
ncbi:unnamed protein product [Cyprideis torosa]|uniref:Uncharacterized protein n=1 Tax=Cyprideis torosa TaxID=163714 RepID=A0A7R8W8S2_9CRUS|nr:unnamed protein product [Cyprideis torosa]CAG0888886.1 unnamed protein product [Cyprideis torosa]